MKFKIPYQYSFVSEEVKYPDVKLVTVPDDTLTPREIIERFSKGLAGNVSDKGEGDYITSSVNYKSVKEQDNNLLGVKMPNPSLDLSEMEAASKDAVDRIAKIRDQFQHAKVANSDPPMPDES